MKVLLIGSGGREHAILWKLSQCKEVDKLYAIPGSSAMTEMAECLKIDINDFKKITTFVKEKGVEITIVGPEMPLVSGIADYFMAEGLKIFGPERRCALLEGSKVFAKNFMKRNKIPTADFEVFNDYNKALDYVKKYTQKISSSLVIKADGLAAGKGVVVCEDFNEANKALDEIMNKKIFGQAGENVVIEKKLNGVEVSLLALCDGDNLLELPFAQDHKRVFDDDRGPNTGGMGAYTPVPFIDKEIKGKIKKEILDRFIEGIKRENLNYTGVIYFGILIEKRNPYVLEFNVRFGDPETQPLMLLIENDILELFNMTLDRQLHKAKISVKDGYSVCVVISSGGYPGSFEKMKKITGLENVKNAIVFHAGTKKIDSQWYTDGGRVLGITATGKTLEEARENVYKNINLINFEKMHFRKDIALKGMTIHL